MFKQLLVLVGEATWLLSMLWINGSLIGVHNFLGWVVHRKKFGFVPFPFSVLIGPLICSFRTFFPMPNNPMMLGYPRGAVLCGSWALWVSVWLGALYVTLLRWNGYLPFLEGIVSRGSMVALSAAFWFFLMGVWQFYLRRISVTFDEVLQSPYKV